MEILKKDKVAVITGASSGIGRALSIQLVKQYKSQFICGRNTESLEKLKVELQSMGAEAIVVPLDLSKSSSVESAAKSILDASEKIDLLVNNAGVSQRSSVLDTSFEVEQNLFQINYFGPVLLSKLLLPSLRSSGNGKFLVTSSIVGKFGFPLRSTYSAAKHALHGYFESLALEEKSHGIKVHLMVVGRAKTSISMNAVGKNGNKYAKMDEGQAQGISTDECASKMIRSMNNNKRESLIGGKELLMVYFKKYLPFLFYKLASKEENHV